MKIKHYLYNTFTIVDGDTKIAIDPGINMKLFHMKSLIPKDEWNSFSHIIVTHGDPDHYAQADLIAQESDAPIFCGNNLTKIIDNQYYIVHPRKGGLKSWIPFQKLFPMHVGDIIKEQNISIEALKTEHGSIFVKMLGITIKKKPSLEERTGIGATGFKITINGKQIVNLGDTLLQKEWAGLKPDILMLPIGGLGNNVWTMDVNDAVKAVEMIEPKLVIPCHYNVPFLIKKNAAPANEHDFKTKVEKLGIHCQLMYNGDELTV
jgi:L-ascorbate metabolism protein UlaG (beta-lactamase superfamily)